MKKVLFIVLALLSVGLTLLWVGSHPPSVEGAPPGPLAQKRVIFEEDIFWTRPAEADRILEKIRDAGFNVYCVNVWHGRGTMWPSDLAPWDPWVAKPDDPAFDPLKYLIQRAKEMDIEVYAWFTVALRQNELFPQYAPAGTPDKAFDIHMSEFQLFMTKLVGEVTDRYDITGVNLDYIRTMGFCKSALCQQQYHTAYERNLLEDIALYESTPTAVMKKALVPTLIDYQEQGVTQMVQTISKRIKGSHPSQLISVDALPGQIGMAEGQNSLKWLEDHLVDVVFRMDYTYEVDFDLLASLRSQLSNPNSLTLLISNIAQEGVGETRRYFPRDAQWLEGKIQEIWERWSEIGIGVYMSKFLSDEQIQHLRKGPGSFPDKEPPPVPLNFRVQ